MENKIVYDFVASINNKNADKIYYLMADDHLFIDAQGHKVSGKDKMKEAWKLYFEWFADYKIEITDYFANGDSIAAFGYASGTFRGISSEKNENYWKIPAAWKVTLHNNKI